MLRQSLVVLAVILGIAQVAFSADAETLLLWPNGAPGAKGTEDHDKPTLAVYTLPKEQANGCAVIVCPGGGYGGLAIGYEGHDVARWFNSFGVTAFVLKYRHAPHYKHPSPLEDVQRAVRIVRSRSQEWNINPAKIGVLGFSAGGHLTSTIGTHFDAGDAQAADPIDRAGCRPDFIVLAYPVISFTTEHTHRGSLKNLLGENPDPALVQSLSNETQVTKETPPTFLFHTAEDTGVPSQNSVLFYLACLKAGVPAEMHIYEKGRHGVGLAPEDPVLSTWPTMCRNWMQSCGFLTAE